MDQRPAMTWAEAAEWADALRRFIPYALARGGHGPGTAPRIDRMTRERLISWVLNANLKAER